MIRADVRTESSIHHGQVRRDEPVVDADPVRKPGWPAPLTAEANPAVAQIRGFQEVSEVRRTVRAVEVADDQGRATRSTDNPGQHLELAAHTEATRLVERREEMDQPEIPTFPREIDHCMQRWHGPGRHRGDAFDRDGWLAEPERDPPTVVVEWSLEAIGKLRTDRLQAVEPGVGDLDQAQRIRSLREDQTDQPFAVLIGREQVRRQDSEAFGRSRIGSNRVRPETERQAPCLPDNQQAESDCDRPVDPDHPDGRHQTDRQGRLPKVGEQVGPPVDPGQPGRQRVNERTDRQPPGEGLCHGSQNSKNSGSIQSHESSRQSTNPRIAWLDQ